MRIKQMAMLGACLLGLGACGNQPAQSSSSIIASSAYDPTIGKINNLKFDKGTMLVTFDAVAGATSYHIYIIQDGDLVVDDKINETSIDVGMLGLAGEISFRVSAMKGKAEGEPSTIEFILDKVMEDVIFEAEDYLYNFGTGKTQSNFRNNNLAHGGAYVGGNDDCGQGLYINYLCPITDSYTFDLYYLAEDVPGYLGVWINNTYQTRFVCPENTGYGGEGMFNTAKSSVTIVLEKGWNTISIMKEGTQAEKWGSFVEMDYFVLKSKGKTYDPSEMKQYGENPAYWRLEAEMGSPRHKNTLNNVFECKNPCIKYHDSFMFSNGYLMGNLDSKYDGVEWQFNAKKAGKYQITMAYASAMTGCEATFFTTEEEVDLAHSADFKRMTGSSIALPQTTGWDYVERATATAIIELAFDKNFIYCINMKESGTAIYQIDYIDMVYLGE